jgi:hypothetical protein
MKSTITNTRMAGKDHVVVTVLTEGRKAAAFRREPCEQCPWRKDQVGKFPAEAFRHSAPTCYDAAMSTFGCHMSKQASPLTCAGFLLSESAQHNLMVRISAATMGLKRENISSPVPIFPNYREMAVANGVAADDPVLEPCRDRHTKIKRG